jgi:hypothetical protein
MPLRAGWVRRRGVSFLLRARGDILTLRRQVSGIATDCRRAAADDARREVQRAHGERLREVVQEQNGPQSIDDNTETGRKKPGRLAIQLLPSQEIPPLGTGKWICGVHTTSRRTLPNFAMCPLSSTPT